MQVTPLASVDSLCFGLSFRCRLAVARRRHWSRVPGAAASCLAAPFLHTSLALVAQNVGSDRGEEAHASFELSNRVSLSATGVGGNGFVVGYV